MKLLDHSLYAVEKELESDAVKEGVARYKRLAREAEQRGRGASLKASERLLVHWFKAYCKAVRKERRACEARRAGIGRGVYGSYMRLLDTDKAAVIAMHTTLGICLANPAGIHDTKVVLAIGRNLNAQLTRRRFRKTERDSWNALMHTDRKQIKPKGVLKIARKFFPEEVWPLRVQSKIGATLLKLLIATASVPGENRTAKPAFELFEVRRGKRMYYHLRLTQDADKIVRDGHVYRQVLRPRYEPMVVKPAPWSGESKGGYIYRPAELIKKSHQRGTMPAKIPQELYQALNIANETPWRINRKVLRVALFLRDEGGNVQGIPRATDIPEPLKPAGFESDDEKRKAWRRKAAQVYRENVNLKGERTVAWAKLDIAERFAKYNRIYFPHNLDFRGRFYAIPLFLNHQSDDLCRGLLEFADPKPANAETAQRWLLLHMANCCGYDKTSYADRLQWVDSGMPDFAKWAAAPVENTGWLEVDKPWQALAAAFALFDPEAAAHLPVQVDGSNNALQHYGAMLRCPETAALANLAPSDTPQDAYGLVADRARRLIGGEAQQGLQEAIKLEGWVTRKIVKQPVMTSVYGVTPVGARRQVADALKKGGYRDDELYQIARHLSRVALQSFNGVCVAAHEAMSWLRACGNLIANERQPIRWTSPIGLEIEEHYRTAHRIEVRTILHRFYLHERDKRCPIHKRRQVNAFAPSFVHAIDATHLARTMIRMKEQDRRAVGLQFAGVHDCFWTHAADMDMLSKTLRETFLELHEVPLLGDLYRQLRENYPGFTFPPPPETGGFDLSQVLQSRYFFS